MKIILLESVRGLGDPGDIINVKRTPIGVLSAAMNEVIPPITSSLFFYELYGGE